MTTRSQTCAVTNAPINYAPIPTKRGHFGPYGGKFVPETLMPALEELEEVYLKSKHDRDFQAELDYLLRTFVGRPTPLTFAERLTAHFGGPRIYIKREDLAHTGAHKINNALGQALLMKRKMNKTRIVAETGAGQHGVATATVAAKLGIECVVYMGTVDMARQQPNVYRMQLLGTEVRGVESGSKTLKDAINEAIRDWVTNVRTTHYLLGSALGPHPYPAMVRDFQSVIGTRVIRPDAGPATRDPAACPMPWLPVWAAAATRSASSTRILEYDSCTSDRRRGRRSRHRRRRACCPFCRPQDGPARRAAGHQELRAAGRRRPDCPHPQHQRRAGLCQRRAGARLAARPGPHRIHLRHRRRSAGGVKLLSRMEGIIPALESAHAMAELVKLAPQMGKDQVILVNLSGRGDKDLGTIMHEMGDTGRPGQ